MHKSRFSTRPDFSHGCHIGYLRARDVLRLILYFSPALRASERASKRERERERERERGTGTALHIDGGLCIFTETFSLCDRDFMQQNFLNCQIHRPILRSPRRIFRFIVSKRIRWIAIIKSPSLQFKIVTRSYRRDRAK